MTKLGAFTKDTAERILRAVNILDASGLLNPGVLQSLVASGTVVDEEPVWVRNVSGEEIPAYACMQVTGTVNESGGVNYLQVDKPADNSGAAGSFVFNSHEAIANNADGLAQAGTANLRGYKNSGTVSAGDAWQPVASQWYIAAGGGMFIAHGEDDIASNVVKVSISGGGNGATMLARSPGGGIDARTGTSTSGPWTPGSASCLRCTFGGSTITLGAETVTVYNSTDQDIAPEVVMQCKKIDGYWWVDVASCASASAYFLANRDGTLIVNRDGTQIEATSVQRLDTIPEVEA